MKIKEWNKTNKLLRTMSPDNRELLRKVCALKQTDESIESDSTPHPTVEMLLQTSGIVFGHHIGHKQFATVRLSQLA